MDLYVAGIALSVDEISDLIRGKLLPPVINKQQKEINGLRCEPHMESSQSTGYTMPHYDIQVQHHSFITTGGPPRASNLHGGTGSRAFGKVHKGVLRELPRVEVFFQAQGAKSGTQRGKSSCHKSSTC
ncbi:hypothetical protein OS493_032984 [Desmophyllum pertusum]|uniref:Uncharacterized protein n=1 Tax=Desmophyllum pertusum TaxID=174260 RepID=A0A9W9ZX88_9CNID|nr:hypothetical protein OS493_032984 [Desmophyllum pertusum]